MTGRSRKGAGERGGERAESIEGYDMGQSARGVRGVSKHSVLSRGDEDQQPRWRGATRTRRADQRGYGVGRPGARALRYTTTRANRANRNT